MAAPFTLIDLKEDLLITKARLNGLEKTVTELKTLNPLENGQMIKSDYQLRQLERQITSQVQSQIDHLAEPLYRLEQIVTKLEARLTKLEAVLAKVDTSLIKMTADS